MATSRERYVMPRRAAPGGGTEFDQEAEEKTVNMNLIVISMGKIR